MKKYIFLFVLLFASSLNLQALQIGTNQIKDKAITTAKLDDEAVNDTKLSATLKATIDGKLDSADSTLFIWKDGSQDYTANQSMGGKKITTADEPTADSDYATKYYVDNNAGGGGYTNLTQFVDQTAWRLFYSNADGDVIEFALGADGTYLMSNGAEVAPTFETPAGDVVGPAEAVDNRIVVFDGVTGKLVKDSGSLISDLLDTADSTLFVWHDGSIDFTADQSMGGFSLTNMDEPAADSEAATKYYVDQGLAGKQATGDYLEDSEFASAGLMKTDGAGGYSIVTDNSVYWEQMSDEVASDSPNWDAAYTLKGVLDALNGLIKGDGAGNYSAVTDNSSDWNTVTDKLNSADTDIFALIASGRPFTGQQDFQDGIKADTIVESTVDAGVIVEGTLHKDNDVYTGSVQIDEDAGAVTAIDMSVSATPGAGTEEGYAFQVDSTTIAKTYSEADSDGGIKNYWWHMELAKVEPRALADSPVIPQEGCLWMEATVTDSGLNLYRGGAWERVLATASTPTAGMFLQADGTNAPVWGKVDLAAATDITGTLGAANGGSGLNSLIDHTLLIGSGTDPVTLTGVGTNGQILLGQTSADPTWQTMDTDATIDETGTMTIAAEAVTYAKMQHISATARLLGRSTAGAGDVEEITVGGDITQSGSDFTIGADKVSYDKMQDVSATDKLLGRSTAGAGTVEEVPCTATGRAILAANALTRYLHWSPAYDGYALSADGGSNDAGDSGIIVAFAGTLGDSDNNDTPYIEWSSTESGVSDYDVIIRIPIPADYSSMTTFRVEYDSDTVQEDTATVYLYDSNDDADSSVVLSSSTWAVDESMTPSGTYTAGEHMTIKIHLEASQNQYMRIGEIKIPYVATR